MSARWNPTASGPGALGGTGAGGGGGGAGVYTEKTFNYTGGAQTFNLSDTNGQPITAYLFGPGGGAEGDTATGSVLYPAVLLIQQLGLLILSDKAV